MCVMLAVGTTEVVLVNELFKIGHVPPIPKMKVFFS